MNYSIKQVKSIYAKSMVESKKKRILLAEDDASMRRFVEIILQQGGYEVLTAEDGLIAMQIALAENIEAVVADAIMPHLSGYDLCRMLRGNDDKKHVPLVILSGLTTENSDEPDCIADAFLVKDPKLKEKLTATLQKLLQ